MIVGFGFTVLLLGLLAVTWIKRGLAAWRNETTEPVRGGRFLLLLTGHYAKPVRALVAAGVGIGFVLLVMLAVLLDRFAGTDRGGTVPLLARVGVLGAVGACGLYYCICWFNRPRFLVPPHLRCELGTVTEWWQRRRA
ncbi:hypothetical protein GCM10010440_56090 [Kitasatospora cinereorecta]